MKTTKFLSFVLAIAMLITMTIVSVSAMTGDIDGDEDITAQDYMMLKRAVLRTFKLNDTQTANGDIDGDGEITAQDYMMIKRVVLGTYTLTPSADPVIDAIESALESKGEITNTFPTTYLSQEGVATVSFKMVDDVLSLYGHLDITSLGASVDISIPLTAVADKYTFSGQAQQGENTIDIRGNLIAKEYSKNDQTLDVTFTASEGFDLDTLEAVLPNLCKTAMNEFLAQADDLLIKNEAGVNIGDLGFTTFYNQLHPAVSE